METKISRKGYSIKKSDLSESQISNIKKELSVKPYIPYDFNISNNVSS